MGASLPGGGGGRGRAMNFDLNLVPFIDLMTSIITFLIATAVWIQIASINVEQSIQDPNTPPPPPPDTPPVLPLTVHVRADGISVFRDIKEAQNVPAVTEGLYDWDTIAIYIKAEREKYPEESQATIITDDGIAYKHMIHALDLTREAGFEKSLLGGGPPDPNAPDAKPNGG